MLLAVVSGSTDAIGFIHLGGAFSSVMTGNMVLLGLASSTHQYGLALHAAVAIAAFILGCVIGAGIAGTPQEQDSVWPAAITRALTVELGSCASTHVRWRSLAGT